LNVSADSSNSKSETTRNDVNSELTGILEVLHKDIPGVKVFCGRHMNETHFNHVLEFMFPLANVGKEDTQSIQLSEYIEEYDISMLSNNLQRAAENIMNISIV